ncbi:hypothetical protein FAZ69_17830 [Trinickia terrae]|uniref:DUF4148 domain-containing protein n=1 Tax=Trinickia terrae TaxID=2571161 RepID=A0A4U1I2B6_9BURK|nr:hypothetical protein [Trinickia terrae]TKC87334.1 hypothetical protein FAZ69_17830 [Trinickia terrae]
MTGGVWPNARIKVVALALAGGLASAAGPVCVHAESFNEHPSEWHQAFRRKVAQPVRADHLNPADRPASEAIVRAAVPPDLDQRRRDGHMTPEERRLLRQHIEDAVRELYKR